MTTNEDLIRICEEAQIKLNAIEKRMVEQERRIDKAIGVYTDLLKDMQAYCQKDIRHKTL